MNVSHITMCLWNSLLVNNLNNLIQIVKLEGINILRNQKNQIRRYKKIYVNFEKKKMDVVR